jgi:hypothetical protein
VAQTEAGAWAGILVRDLIGDWRAGCIMGLRFMGLLDAGRDMVIVVIEGITRINRLPRKS